MQIQDELSGDLSQLSFSILEECEKEIRFQREEFWITKLSQTENIVNIYSPTLKRSRVARIACANPRFKGKQHSEVSKLLIRENTKGHRGRVLTSEQSARIRSFRTPESIERIRQASIKNTRKIINLDTQEVYNSALDAAQKLGVTTESIRAAARGTIKTCCGFKFAYHKP